MLLNATGRVPIKDVQIKEILQSKPGYIKRIRQGAFSVIVYQTILFSVASYFNFYFAVILCLSPFTFTLINKILEINQHLLMKTHTVDFRENSRTMRFNPFIEFLYSNMNFHSEHHMYPGVPYYKLPKLSLQLQIDRKIEVPKKGLRVATRVAMSSGVSSISSMDCLSCFAECPLTSAKTPEVGHVDQN